MRRRTRIAAVLVLVVVMVAVGLAVSGSGATTSRAEARSVAVAETRFLGEWRHSYRAMTVCEGRREETSKCARRVEGPLQGKAVEVFTAAIEAMLEEGVGPVCAKSLKDTQVYIFEVPWFPGESTVACRRESLA